MSEHPLDPDQQAVCDAVYARNRTPIVVSARAGSGKTETLVRTYVRLVEEPYKGKRVHPRRIWAMSFSSDAAKEVKARIEDRLDKRLPKSAPIGTFHGRALRVLRHLDDGARWDMGRNVDVAGFRSAVPNQHVIMYNVLGWGTIPWVKAKGLDIEDPDIGEYLTAIGWLRGRELMPDSYEVHKLIHAEFPKLERLHAAWHLYEKSKAGARAWDFSDALVAFRDALAEDRLPADFPWPSIVFVDEAQDSNIIQYDIARMLAAKRGKLVLLGDWWQAIYEWRGASPELFKDAPKDLGAKVCPLRTNYRSGNEIVALSVAVSGEEARPRKGAGTAVVNKTQLGPEANTLVAEGEAIGRIIAAALEAGRAPMDIAVLLRSNAHLAPVEMDLHKRDIPVQVIGRSFWSRAEVQTFLAYATLFEAPTINALQHAINRPKRYLSKAHAGAVWGTMEREGCSLPDALRRARGPKALGFRQQQTVEHLALWFEELQRAPWNIQAKAIADLLVEGAQSAPVSTQERVEESMEVIVEMAARAPSVGLFVGSAKDAEERTRSRDRDEDAVTLMTLHGAKGLEWPMVIIGCTEGRFPHDRAMDGFSGEHLRRHEKGHIVLPDRVLRAYAEEKRLFYVGITRPKEELNLVYSTPGAFIDLVPDKLVPLPPVESNVVPFKPR